jgi:hypothetical protein
MQLPEPGTLNQTSSNGIMLPYACGYEAPAHRYIFCEEMAKFGNRMHSSDQKNLYFSQCITRYLGDMYQKKISSQDSHYEPFGPQMAEIRNQASPDQAKRFCLSSLGQVCSEGVLVACLKRCGTSVWRSMQK